MKVEEIRKGRVYLLAKKDVDDWNIIYIHDRIEDDKLFITAELFDDGDMHKTGFERLSETAGVFAATTNQIALLNSYISES